MSAATRCWPNAWTSNSVKPAVDKLLRNTMSFTRPDLSSMSKFLVDGTRSGSIQRSNTNLRVRFLDLEFPDAAIANYLCTIEALGF